MSKLKLCPFCGGEAWTYSEDDGWNHLGENCYRAEVRCESCGAMFELHHHGDDLYTDEDDTPNGIRCRKLEEQAAVLWNRRTPKSSEATPKCDRDALLQLADEIVLEHEGHEHDRSPWSNSDAWSFADRIREACGDGCGNVS